MQAALGMGEGAAYRVVPDPEPDAAPNPWRTYRECLRLGAQLEGPFAVIQDDCIPAVGFLGAATKARTRHPTALLVLCCQGMLNHSIRNAYWRAHERGERYLPFTPSSWVPAMALGWTPELAARALEWDAQQHTLRENFTSDDGRLYYFARWANVPCVALIPSIVDHPDDVPTVGSQKAGKRRPARSTLLLCEGDASALEW